jgi:hypothetical protein
VEEAEQLEMRMRSEGDRGALPTGVPKMDCTKKTTVELRIIREPDRSQNVRRVLVLRTGPTSREVEAEHADSTRNYFFVKDIKIKCEDKRVEGYA